MNSFSLCYNAWNISETQIKKTCNNDVDFFQRKLRVYTLLKWRWTKKQSKRNTNCFLLICFFFAPFFDFPIQLLRILGTKASMLYCSLLRWIFSPAGSKFHLQNSYHVWIGCICEEYLVHFLVQDPYVFRTTRCCNRYGTSPLMEILLQ